MAAVTICSDFGAQNDKVQVGQLTLKILKMTSTDKGMDNWNAHPLLEGMQNGTTLEAVLVMPFKARNTLPLLLLYSCSIMCNSLQSHGLQHTKLPCTSQFPGLCSHSCLLSRWCHPTISSSVITFSSCSQSFPASGSFPVSRLFASGGLSIGALASVLLIEYAGLIFFRIDWFDFLAVQGTVKSLLQHHSSKAQPYIFVYPFSPRLPSHPGCCITLSRVLCSTVGPCWLSILNISADLF